MNTAVERVMTHRAAASNKIFNRLRQIWMRGFWWETVNNQKQVGASAIIPNNIQVTIYTFAFGALCGLGTLFYLAYNGANIASVLALTYRADRKSTRLNSSH